MKTIIVISLLSLAVILIIFLIRITIIPARKNKKRREEFFKFFGFYETATIEKSQKAAILRKLRERAGSLINLMEQETELLNEMKMRRGNESDYSILESQDVKNMIKEMGLSSYYMSQGINDGFKSVDELIQAASDKIKKEKEHFWAMYNRIRYCYYIENFMNMKVWQTRNRLEIKTFTLVSEEEINWL